MKNFAKVLLLLVLAGCHRKQRALLAIPVQKSVKNVNHKVNASESPVNASQAHIRQASNVVEQKGKEVIPSSPKKEVSSGPSNKARPILTVSHPEVVSYTPTPITDNVPDKDEYAPEDDSIQHDDQAHIIRVPLHLKDHYRQRNTPYSPIDEHKLASNSEEETHEKKLGNLMQIEPKAQVYPDPAHKSDTDLPTTPAAENDLADQHRLASVESSSRDVTPGYLVQNYDPKCEQKLLKSNTTEVESGEDFVPKDLEKESLDTPAEEEASIQSGTSIHSKSTDPEARNVIATLSPERKEPDLGNESKSSSFEQKDPMEVKPDNTLDSIPDLADVSSNSNYSAKSKKTRDFITRNAGSRSIDLQAQDFVSEDETASEDQKVHTRKYTRIGLNEVDSSVSKAHQIKFPRGNVNMGASHAMNEIEEKAACPIKESTSQGDWPISGKIEIERHTSSCPPHKTKKSVEGSLDTPAEEASIQSGTSIHSKSTDPEARNVIATLSPERKEPDLGNESKSSSFEQKDPMEVKPDNTLDSIPDLADVSSNSNYSAKSKKTRDFITRNAGSRSIDLQAQDFVSEDETASEDQKVHTRKYTRIGLNEVDSSVSKAHQIKFPRGNVNMGASHAMNEIEEKAACPIKESTSQGDWPALHGAVQDGKLEFIKNLIEEKDADVNEEDHKKRTPLHIAVLYNHKDVVALLIENSADVNAEDAEGNKPMDYAENEDIKKALRAQGDSNMTIK